MKYVMEDFRGLRYKLQVMGVPVPEPSFVLGNNQSVVFSTLRPESTLRKKSNLICYHAVCESVAMSEMLTGHVPLKLNLANLLTKVLFVSLCKILVGRILEDICDTFPTQ